MESSPANQEAIEAWNSILFDKFVRFRHIVTAGLGGHGDIALARNPPAPSSRALDVGCGFGDTTQQIAGMIGPDGLAVGIDAAARFIDSARQEAEAAGLRNVRFVVGDVQTHTYAETFDYVFSRFGVMFFANPVVALRSVRAAMAPGGTLCMVVWRQKADNAWLHRAEQVVDRFVKPPEQSDQPTCGPGPFSMAGADMTSDVLKFAGFSDIAFLRNDAPICIGSDLEEAVEFSMAVGPAGEVLRLAKDDAERLRPELTAALREALSEFVSDGGVLAPASTWIVTARA